MADQNPTLTAVDIARRLRVKPRTAYDMLAPGGVLHHLRLPLGAGTVRVDAAEFEKYLASRGSAS